MYECAAVCNCVYTLAFERHRRRGQTNSQTGRQSDKHRDRKTDTCVRQADLARDADLVYSSV